VAILSKGGRVLLVGGAASLAMACGRTGGATEEHVAVVARRTVEDIFLLTGELAAVRSNELTVPRLEGGRAQVKWIAEDGSEVKAGESVAELDNTQVAASLEEKRLRLVQAQIALEQREATLGADASQKRLTYEKAVIDRDKAKIDADVPEELRSRKEWHEKQQALLRANAALEKADTDWKTFEESSQAEVSVLRITRDKAARDVEMAERSLRQLALVAPRDGIAIVGRAPNDDRPLQIGDNIWVGFRVASIPDLSSMEVVAFLPEVDEGRVVKGQDARVILETDLDRCFRGKVAEVSAVAQDARFAGGFKVRVSIDETDPKAMRPGLSARVEVVRGTYKDALLVPRQAVARGERTATVRRAGANVEVTLGACLPLECVVESGLKEGEHVALP
jgi:multidrug resistance efflux pump